MVSETLPAERQGTNLILSVHQGIPIPEFLSSYGVGTVDNFLPWSLRGKPSLPVGREEGWMEGKIKFQNFTDVPHSPHF